MGFGSEVEDGVGLEVADGGCGGDWVSEVEDLEGEARVGGFEGFRVEAGVVEVVGVGGVGEGVDCEDLGVWVLEEGVGEVGADEAGCSGDDCFGDVVHVGGNFQGGDFSEIVHFWRCFWRRWERKRCVFVNPAL